MKKVEDLKVKIFADGADKAGMLEMYEKPFVKGLTTNPTLMNKAGITDYKAFCKDNYRLIVIDSNCGEHTENSILKKKICDDNNVEFIKKNKDNIINLLYNNTKNYKIE